MVFDIFDVRRRLVVSLETQGSLWWRLLMENRNDTEALILCHLGFAFYSQAV